jgi:hypothetical protein
MDGRGVSEGNGVSVGVNVGVDEEVNVETALAVPVMVGRIKVAVGDKEVGLQAENVSTQRKDRARRRDIRMVP